MIVKNMYCQKLKTYDKIESIVRQKGRSFCLKFLNIKLFLRQKLRPSVFNEMDD